MALRTSFWLLQLSLLFGLTPSVGATASSSQLTCTKLATALPGRVFAPGTASYTSSVNQYYFLENRQGPTCIVIPQSADQVSRAVTILVSSPSTQFAIKGGGHSPNTGYNSIVNGVTIDLGGLDAIKVVPGAVQIGPGASWEEVYNVLDPLNLSTLGGRVASVGVGGFLTGGGLSFFGPQYGFACNAIVNIQFVLASGSIINVNSNSYPDLFQAIKGGQNNFGIVTRFDVATHYQPPFWGGSIQYTSAADDDQLAAFTAYKMGKYDPNAEVEQTFVYFGQEQFYLSTNNMYYAKPIVNASGLSYFINIPNQIDNTMRISNASDFANELEALQPHNQFAVYATCTFAITQTILKKVFSQWQTTTAQLSSIPNITSVITFQTVPPPPPASNPNSLGFPPNSTPQINLVLALVSIYWPQASDSATVQSATQSLLNAIKAQTDSEGVSKSFEYLNYAAYWQNPIAGYGAASVAFMEKVAAKYDPTRVFKKQVPGGFKLP